MNCRSEGVERPEKTASRGLKGARAVLSGLSATAVGRS